MRFISAVFVTLSAAGALAQEAPSASADSTDTYEGLIVPTAVQTASQRTQSLIETGPGVTVLSASEIQRLGVQNLGDVLRYAVGTMVTPVSANYTNFGLRGIGDERNNRVLVLLDGRNPVDLSLGFPRFQYLPLHPDDIERIEILRGPSTTRFGANAVAGVVNIIRKRPVDHHGVEGTASAILNWQPDDETNPDERGHPHINTGGVGHASYGVVNDAGTTGFRLEVGTLHQPEFTIPQPIPSRTRHGYYNWYLNASGQYKPSDDLDFYVNVSTSQDESIFPASASIAGRPAFARETALTTNLRWAPADLPGFVLNVQADGQLFEQRFAATVSGTLFVPGNTPTQKALHGKAIADYTFFDNRNTFSLGLEASTLTQGNYYQSDFGAGYASLAVEDELRLLSNRNLIVSAGARLERATTDTHLTGNDDAGRLDNKYGNFNPRGSIVYRIDRDNALRISAATAYRTPSPFENYALFGPANPSPPPTPTVPSLQRQNALRAEQARSVEAGYRGLLFGRLLLDTTFYLQSLRNIIIASRQQTIPGQFINTGGSVNGFGIELATTYNITSDVKVSANYAYNHASGTTRELGHEYEGQATFQAGWPIHIYNLLLEWKFADKWRFNAMYWAALKSKTTFTDLNGGPVNNADQHWLEGYLGRQLFSGGAEAFMTVRNALGFTRDLNNLRYSNTVNYDPIGAQVIFGLRVSEVGL